MALPAGARTFRREWAALIPRGATVALAHDADEHGDDGAEHAARIIGGRTLRVRPPVDGGDWCDWDGGRDELLELIRREIAAAGTVDPVEIVAAEVFAAEHEPGAEALLGDGDDDAVLPAGGDSMLYGDGGAGKSTLALHLAMHLASGTTCLGITVQRPVNVLLLENEGPRPLYRRKIERKLTDWLGRSTAGRLHVWQAPWGKAGFGSLEQRQQLADAVADNAIDVRIAGPLTRLGMDEAGTLQRVRDFTLLVQDVRDLSERPLHVLLLHHENRGGTVSGAWEGAGDTLMHLQAQGHGKTLLYFQKVRHASRWHKQTLNLLWTEGEGFAVEERDEFDDNTLADRILEHVRGNPAPPGRRSKTPHPA